MALLEPHGDSRQDHHRQMVDAPLLVASGYQLKLLEESLRLVVTRGNGHSDTVLVAIPPHLLTGVSSARHDLLWL